MQEKKDLDYYLSEASNEGIDGSVDINDILKGENVTENVADFFVSGGKKLIKFISEASKFIYNRKTLVTNSFGNFAKKFGNMIVTVKKGSSVRFKDEDSIKIGKMLAVYEVAGINWSLPDNLDSFYRGLVFTTMHNINTKFGVDIKVEGHTDHTLGDKYKRVSDLISKGDIVIDSKSKTTFHPIYIKDDKVKFVSVEDDIVHITNGKLKEGILKSVKIKEMKGNKILEAMDSNAGYIKVFDVKSGKIIDIMLSINKAMEDINNGKYKTDDEEGLLVRLKTLKSLIDVGDIMLDFIDVNTSMLIKVGATYSIAHENAERVKAVKRVNA